MDQIADRPEIETCAKWPLGQVLRIGALLAALGFASVLTVDLPSFATSGSDTAQPYVPASDKWIELGATPERSAPALSARPVPEPARRGRRGG